LARLWWSTIPLFALPGQKWSNSEANTRWHEAFPNEARESVHAMLDDAALQRSFVTHLQYDLQKSYETNDKLRRRIASYEAAEKENAVKKEAAEKVQKKKEADKERKRKERQLQVGVLQSKCGKGAQTWWDGGWVLCEESTWCLKFVKKKS